MQTADLVGSALDWAVAKCIGIEMVGLFFWGKGDLDAREYGPGFKPTTDWADGGPIIEREGINIIQCGSWMAEMDADYSGGVISAEGPTPLIAAMRCYVASKLGDEIEIPKELK